MSNPVHASSNETTDLLSAQKALIQAQQEFIRIQQFAVVQKQLGTCHDPRLAPSEPVTSELPSSEGAETAAPLKIEVPADESRDGAGAEAASLLGFNPKILLSGVLPLILGIILIALIVRKPRDLADMQARLGVERQRHVEEADRLTNALKQNQLELEANRKALEQTQSALKSTEQALSDRDQENTVVTSRATGPSSVAKKPAPILTDDEILANAQAQLRDARSALTANRRDLINNLREYRATARSLANDLLGIYNVRQTIRRTKGEISDDDITAQKKTWEDFLPAGAQKLINDLRLDSDVPSAGSSSNRDADVPSSLPEVGALLVKTVNELTAVMRQLTVAQAQIVQCQSDITSARRQHDVILNELGEIQADSAARNNGEVGNKSTTSGRQ